MAVHDDDVIAMQTKLAWQAEKVEGLSDALIDKEERITALEERVGRLERALTILAQRQSTPAADVAGANEVDDPVPRSG